MKRVMTSRVVLLACMVLMVCTAQAQRQKVKSIEVPGKKYTVILETPECEIHFNIDDLRAAWEATKEELKSRSERYDNGVKGMAWLNLQKGVFHVRDPELRGLALRNGQKVEDGEGYFFMSLSHGFGTKLIRDGMTKVYRTEDKQVQPEFEYRLLASAKWSNVYGFYFTGESKMFFKGEVVGEPVIEEEPKTEKKENSAVFTKVVIAPQYPGGDAKFKEYVKKNAGYSKQARDQKLKGTVFVSLKILKDGTLSDIKVIRGVHEELDREALRLVSESGKWIPGKEDGKVSDSPFVTTVSLDAAGN